MDMFSGAIDSMCPNSADLQDLGESVVPTHTIQAWYLDLRVRFSLPAFSSIAATD